MGRCIMVLGIPRSGTSALAGTLHNLGVDMGSGHLQQGNRWNEKGYFEDLRWQRLNKDLTGERYEHAEVDYISDQQAGRYKELARECDRGVLWGMKDPRLCFTAHFIWPFLEDCRVIVIRRNFNASAASLTIHSQKEYNGQYAMDLKAAREVCAIWNRALSKRLAAFTGHVLEVSYECILRKTEENVEEIAAFSFEGLSVEPNLKPGISFIEKRLMHNGELK